jgi:DNA polymerase-4
MDRDILHIYIPCFPIALARISNPSLRNRAVAVAPGHSERALIQHLSIEARSDGLFEGMPLFKARRMCPSLVILPPDPRRVSSGNRALAKLSREYSPVWEPSSTGRIYLDLTGSARLFGPGRDAALKLERDLTKRLNLTGWVGVAGNKLVSRIAAGYLPKPGVCDVLRGSEAGFIAPLPVTVIPGIGEIRQRILLGDLNLSLVGQIASLTLPQLSLPFGSFAPLLFHRARGIDPSPVLPPRRIPEVSRESLLHEGVNDDTILLAELYRLVEECGLHLRSTGKAATKLILTITHSDGLSRQRTISIKDPVHRDAQIFHLVERLFGEASMRRVGIKWMCLVCEGLTEPRGQLEMFADTEESGMEGNLQDAMDAVRGKYGMSAVSWGRTADRVQSAECRVQSTGRRAQGEERATPRSEPQTSNLKPQTRTRS